MMFRSTAAREPRAPPAGTAQGAPRPGMERRVISLLAAAFVLSLGFAIAQAANESGLPVPRYVSLGSGEVNLRTGPGVRYPIEWVYRRRTLPVEVIGEYDAWRHIRDWQGTDGWVHQSMLAGRRTVMILNDDLPLRRSGADEAPAVAVAKAGVIAALKRCQDDWCEIEAAGYEGWVKRRNIWGVYPDERVQ
jgi:SH3-like domain-containing protein